MDNQGVKRIIKFLQINYKDSLTHPQYEQLRYLKSIENYDIRALRKVFSTAISIGVCPECEYCHQVINDVDELTIDHTIPRAHGGTDAIENLQPMHAKCNSAKGCSLPESAPTDALEQLVNTPRPRRHSGKRPIRPENVSGHSIEDLERKCKRIDEFHGCKYSIARTTKTR